MMLQAVPRVLLAVAGGGEMGAKQQTSSPRHSAHGDDFCPDGGTRVALFVPAADLESSFPSQRSWRQTVVSCSRRLALVDDVSAAARLLDVTLVRRWRGGDGRGSARQLAVDAVFYRRVRMKQANALVYPPHAHM